MRHSDAPDIAENLEWTFIEDACFDGASTQELRAHFLAWRGEAFRAEQKAPQPRADVPQYGSPRYDYFIQVDEAALRSIFVENDDDRPWWDGFNEGYVNFVNANWKSLAELGLDPGDEEHESIHGCTEEDVGWMKMSAGLVGAEFYEAMIGVADLWYVFYKRPPAVNTW
ncbi:hypothetical protein QQX98_010291 [Neonectria punicea]|uniref:Uncharacterized protein n=1 Tax=Neonectria punicea TaxID=979145 RepID=A0ABR1GPT3_9HYPO